MTTLADIRLKVRRVTKSPSANQITNAEIDDYVNDFYQQDFPAHLKTWNLKTMLSPLGLAGADDALIPNRAIYAFDWVNFKVPKGENEVYVVFKVPGTNPDPSHFLSSLFKRTDSQPN